MEYTDLTSSLIDKNRQYKIALFSSQDTHKTKQFIDGFNSCMQHYEDLNYNIDTYSVADIKALFKRIEFETYDIMLCSGHDGTLYGKDLISLTNGTLPLIFSNITDVSSGANLTDVPITGLTTPLYGYARQMSQALPYFPSVKKILILLDQDNSIMRAMSAQLPDILKEQEYEVSVHSQQPTLTRQEILDIAAHDMVMLLSQNSSEHYMHRLSLLCKEHKTILYVADTNAVMHGAALGFGEDENLMGYHAAHSAYQILSTNSLPEIESVSYSLKLNLIAMEEQGVKLVDMAPLLSLINATRVITPTTQEKISAYLRLEQIPIE